MTDLLKTSTDIPINQDLTRSAAENGLGHWMCIGRQSNAWWIRSDGFEYTARFHMAGLWDELRWVDEVTSERSFRTQDSQRHEWSLDEFRRWSEMVTNYQPPPLPY